MPKTAEKHNVVAELLPHLKPIDQLITHPENSRVGNVDLVAASLERLGQYRAAVVQKSSGYVCVGNHMLQAAERLGWTHLAAIELDLTDAQARDLRITDNRTGDVATYDPEKQLAELELLRQDAAKAALDQGNAEATVEAAQQALQLVGFDQASFDALAAQVRGRPTGAPREAPGEFPNPEDDLKTDYCCPQCGYEWSGQAKPSADA